MPRVSRGGCTLCTEHGRSPQGPDAGALSPVCADLCLLAGRLHFGPSRLSCRLAPPAESPVASPVLLPLVGARAVCSQPYLLCLRQGSCRSERRVPGAEWLRVRHESVYRRPGRPSSLLPEPIRSRVHERWTHTFQWQQRPARGTAFNLTVFSAGPFGWPPNWHVYTVPDCRFDGDCSAVAFPGSARRLSPLSCPQ